MSRLDDLASEWTLSIMECYDTKHPSADADEELAKDLLVFADEVLGLAKEWMRTSRQVGRFPQVKDLRE